MIRLLCIFGIHWEGIVVSGNLVAALSVVKILMPFLSSISWSGMPTGGFCQGIRWVTEFGQANGTSPTWARWGISLDRAGIAAGVAIAAPVG